jgi:hypothetical protein
MMQGDRGLFFSRSLALRIRRNWKKWGWWRTFLVTMVLRFRYMNNTGTYVMDEPWDNLIILDACRLDTFRRVAPGFKLPGKLESRISRGADTTSFLVQNFKGRDCKDIVYVSSNPTVAIAAKGSFSRVVPAWKESLRPQTLYRQALGSLTSYPDKRLIIHFLQPHHPYLGIRVNRNSKGRYLDVLGIFTAGAYTMLDKETQIALYERNLRLVLPFVKDLLARLPGRTVVTADHGEAFGERVGVLRLYGHGAGARIPVLVTVPWLISDNSAFTREKVVSDEETTGSMSRQDENEVRRRLVDLGYE